MKNHARRRINPVLLATASTLCLSGLAACSGGGGSPAGPSPVVTSPPPPPLPAPPPPPLPTTVSQAEIDAQPGLTQININPAFDSGILGAGALIAIIDTGIDVNNPEFAGRIDPRSADLAIAPFVNSDDVREGGANLEDVQGHGTSVAGIAAAGANGEGVVGVAPAATILAFRGNLADDPDTDDEDEALTILGGAISEGFRRSVGAQADVINLSLGSDEDGARDDFANLLSFAGSNNIVTVVSAGNEGDPNPQLSGQSVVESSVGGTAIVVGAVDSNNNITSFSNTAGLAAEFFLVAPGLFTPTPAIGGGTRPFSGTSAATPHVSGTVGLIRSLWPQLSAAETVEIILNSATDLGAPGTDAIFGRGLLNVGAALQPSGQLTVPSSTGSSVTISSLASNLPNAAGTGFSTVESIIGVDVFGRDFEIDIAGLVNAAPTNRFAIGNIADPLLRTRTSISPAPTPGSALTFRLQETSAATDPQFAHLIGDFTSDAAFEAGERDLAFSFTQAIGLDRSLTIANGFSGREIDQLQRREFTQTTLNRSAFSDAFLSDTTDAVSASLNFSVSGATALDILVNHASPSDPFQTNSLLLTNSDRLEEDTTTTVRFGLTRTLPRGAIRVETGVQTEENSFLGTTLSSSLFGDGGSVTVYNTASGHFALTDSLSLTGRFTTGFTKIRNGSIDSLLTDADALRSTQFALGLEQTGIIGRHDVLSLSLSQPLQVRGGDLTFSLPTSFDQQAEQAQFTDISTGFANGGRPLDIEAGYRFNILGKAALQLNAGHSISGLGQGQTAVRVRLSQLF